MPLWDDKYWIKRKVDIPIDYINANEFLVFLYQTKKDICCTQDVAVQLLTNAIDKFFYLLFDFQSYFDVFKQSGLYNSRVEIMDDIIKYKENLFIPKKFMTNLKFMELFTDLIKKMDEWNFWKRQVIISFAKILITLDSYNFAQIHQVGYLKYLLSYIEHLFDQGINAQSTF